MDNESTVVEEKPVEAVEGATLGNPEGTVTEEQKPVEQNPVEEPPKETHDVRRMKKYIDRAVIAEAELKALKAQVGGQQQPVQREGAPLKRENFESDEAFLDAKVEEKVINFLATNDQKAVMNTFQLKEVEARKEKPDYDEVIADASNVRIPPIVVEAILTSDLGPDLRYYLAQNPEKAQRLNFLPAASAARELGKIEAQIIAEKSAKPTIKVSGAPAPIKPVVSNGVTVETDLGKLPNDEYFKRRNEERRKLGKKY